MTQDKVLALLLLKKVMFIKNLVLLGVCKSDFIIITDNILDNSTTFLIIIDVISYYLYPYGINNFIILRFRSSFLPKLLFKNHLNYILISLLR